MSGTGLADPRRGVGREKPPTARPMTAPAARTS